MMIMAIIPIIISTRKNISKVLPIGEALCYLTCIFSI